MSRTTLPISNTMVRESEREKVGGEGERTCVPDDTCVYYMPKISFGRCPNGR